MNWQDLFAMKTGRKLTDAEAIDWKAELDHDLDRNTPDGEEICNAIRWAFAGSNIKQFKKRSKWDYDQPYLRMLVCLWRKECSVSALGDVDTLEPLRREIRKTTDHEDIWEIICRPPTIEECDALKAFAKNTHPQWVQPKPARLSGRTIEIESSYTTEGDTQ